MADIEIFNIENVIIDVNATTKEISLLLPEAEKDPLDISVLNKLAKLYWQTSNKDIALHFLEIAQNIAPENVVLAKNVVIVKNYSFSPVYLGEDKSKMKRTYEMAKLSHGRVLCLKDISRFISFVPYFDQYTFLDNSQDQKWNQKMITWFDEKNGTIGNPSSLPFKKNSFDTIFFPVDFFSDDFTSIFEEFKRVCSPKGQIIIEIDQLKFFPGQYATQSSIETMFKNRFTECKPKFIQINQEYPYLLLFIEIEKISETKNNNLPISQQLFKSDKLVSVIIPTYNRADLLTRAINSVLAQNYQPIEILVVDDGSTDHTEEIAKGYSHRNVKYIKLPHTGVSSTRFGGTVSLNTGIRQSSGDYITMLCDDDMFLPRSIEIKVRYLNNHPEYDLVSTSCILLNKNNQFAGFDLVPEKFESSALKYVMVDMAMFFNHNQLLRKKVFSQVGFFKENSPVSDTDFNFRLARFCKIGTLPVFAAIMFPSGSAGMTTTEKLINNLKPLLIEAYHNTTLEQIFPEINGLTDSRPEYMRALLQRGNRMINGCAFEEGLMDYQQAIKICKNNPELSSLLEKNIDNQIVKKKIYIESEKNKYLQFLIKLEKSFGKID